MPLPRDLDRLAAAAHHRPARSESGHIGAVDAELGIVGQVGEAEDEPLLGERGEGIGDRAGTVGAHRHVDAHLGSVGPHAGE